MSLAEQIADYLRPPFAIGDATLATVLAEAGQQQLIRATGVTASQYSVANCLHPAATEAPGRALGSGLPWLEYPEFPRLASFYQEHGLEPLSVDELAATQAVEKLRSAWALLESIPTTGASLRALVKTIQVLRSPDPEIDVSYSHPAIPFSVFVSVGENNSLAASLRVAESLLHEAMHLKLTLLEQEMELVRPGSHGMYYSPWRDENRPARGVLHGMFVFAAVREFYQVMQRRGLPEPSQDFSAYREEVITEELALLATFPKVADLTAAGSLLATNLLKQAAAAENPVP